MKGLVVKGTAGSAWATAGRVGGSSPGFYSTQAKAIAYLFGHHAPLTPV